MDAKRQIELLRKKNDKLNRELSEAKGEIKRLNAQVRDKDDALKLYQKSKQELDEVIADLKQKRDEYNTLNKQLRLFRQELTAKSNRFFKLFRR